MNHFLIPGVGYSFSNCNTVLQGRAPGDARDLVLRNSWESLPLAEKLLQMEKVVGKYGFGSKVRWGRRDDAGILNIRRRKRAIGEINLRSGEGGSRKAGDGSGSKEPEAASRASRAD